MSSYKEGQIHQLADVLEVVGFSPEDITALGQNRNQVLTELRGVLLGLAKIVRESLKLACDKPFSPETFIGDGWSVWKGPANGSGLEGDEDRDRREDDLTVIDWEKVVFETHLHDGETSLPGEEKLRRAKNSGNTQLGGRSFLSLWEDHQANRENSLLEKLRRSKGVTRIYFFGLVLRDPLGNRCVLCLYCSGSECSWYYFWLSHPWSAAHPSASLASKP